MRIKKACKALNISCKYLYKSKYFSCIMMIKYESFIFYAYFCLEKRNHVHTK
ncbi:hypothetical protein TFKS16_1822 [Tannerella forsythia KS16]|uniref:Uncharacterized protein n=1 Tax=Tannerella forsythia (strain ATCC 43037 / JCM 10827 / CCUG 21028 A / KCTC 5666 / FDC 338) TaxID=203275 RepID=G8UQT3_TANFA|nr:hypothetical protein BFO_2034 [Tannerella forsythia 92A2]BAR49356.1 hypothetical protein TF3313_1872 [Tannerella forsythia 3313]BAR52048.1 hypothetical protein TFKS16_1822 [Tannerella forsythia KS16]